MKQADVGGGAAYFFFLLFASRVAAEPSTKAAAVTATTTAYPNVLSVIGSSTHVDPSSVGERCENLQEIYALLQR